MIQNQTMDFVSTGKKEKQKKSRNEKLIEGLCVSLLALIFCHDFWKSKETTVILLMPEELREQLFMAYKYGIIEERGCFLMGYLQRPQFQRKQSQD